MSRLLALALAAGALCGCGHDLMVRHRYLHQHGIPHSHLEQHQNDPAGRGSWSFRQRDEHLQRPPREGVAPQR